MICGRCGKKISNSGVFCEKCKENVQISGYLKMELENISQNEVSERTKQKAYERSENVYSEEIKAPESIEKIKEDRTDVELKEINVKENSKPEPIKNEVKRRKKTGTKAIGVAVVALVLCVVGVSGSIVAIKNLNIFNGKEKTGDNVLKDTEKTDKTNNVAKFFIDGGNLDVLVRNKNEAYDALDMVSKIYGYKDVETEFETLKTTTADNNTFYRFGQIYDGIPVYGSSMIIGVSSEGKMFNINGNYKKIENDIKTEPKISIDDAKNKFIELYKDELKEKVDVSNVEKIIYSKENKPVLAFCADVTGYKKDDTFESYRVFIDANTGEEIGRENNILYANATFEGQQGQRNINYVKEDGNNILTDEERKIKVYIPVEQNGWYKDAEDNDARRQVSWENGESPDSVAVDTMANVAKVYDYYKNVLGYNGFGGEDSEIPVYVHLKEAEEDGAGEWSGAAFHRVYSPALSVGVVEKGNAKYDTSLDVIAHEYTHGVIDDIVTLNQSVQASALEEAYADILAICIESYSNEGKPDWKLDDIRNLEKPKENDYPQHMEDYSKKESSYFNSSIISHAAYIMWNDKDAEGAINDVSKLAQLWYGSLQMLDSEASFERCRSAVEVYAKRMLKMGVLTEAQVKRVSEAFDKVGIKSDIYLTEVVNKEFDICVYGEDGKDYDNYHYKIEEISLENGSVVWSKESEVEGYGKVEGKQNGVLYKVTISDLSIDPKAAVSRYILTRRDGAENLNFYTDFTKVEGDDAKKAFYEADQFYREWVYGKKYIDHEAEKLGEYSMVNHDTIHSSEVLEREVKKYFEEDTADSIIEMINPTDEDGKLYINSDEIMYEEKIKTYKKADITVKKESEKKFILNLTVSYADKPTEEKQVLCEFVKDRWLFSNYNCEDEDGYFEC